MVLKFFFVKSICICGYFEQKVSPLLVNQSTSLYIDAIHVTGDWADETEVFNYDITAIIALLFFLFLFLLRGIHQLIRPIEDPLYEIIESAPLEEEEEVDTELLHKLAPDILLDAAAVASPHVHIRVLQEDVPF